MHNAKSTHITDQRNISKQVFTVHHFLPRSTELEWFGLEKTFKSHLPWVGTSPALSDCQDLALNATIQGWGIYHLPGQPALVFHYSHHKTFLSSKSGLF